MLTDEQFKKKDKVLTWKVDDANNDGYISTGSFPISLSKDIKIEEIKKNKSPILFILKNNKNIRIISKVRKNNPGELSSITSDSKYFNEVKDFFYNEVNEFIGFGTLYSKIFEIRKGSRNNYLIKNGVTIELHSTNVENVFLISLIDKDLNTWRRYQTKHITINEIEKEEDILVEKFSKLSDEQLLEKIKSKELVKSTSSVTRYNRNPLVIIHALRRAKNHCEVCTKEAPFMKKGNIPYLEVHHIVPLSENGEDIPENVVAVCPNCHRELHYGINSEKKKIQILNN